jgi:hypothetical protein
MPYSEIIAVCSEIHKKHINTLCGQNVELCNVTLADNWALKGWHIRQHGVARATDTFVIKFMWLPNDFQFDKLHTEEIDVVEKFSHEKTCLSVCLSRLRHLSNFHKHLSQAANRPLPRGQHCTHDANCLDFGTHNYFCKPKVTNCLGGQRTFPTCMLMSVMATCELCVCAAWRLRILPNGVNILTERRTNRASLLSVNQRSACVRVCLNTDINSEKKVELRTELVCHFEHCIGKRIVKCVDNIYWYCYIY